jgi:hypothetical protein
MSLFWGRRGDCWEPEGGERREWRDLLPGDLVVFERKVWRVREVRPVPVVDWDDHDREGYRTLNRDKAGEEDWRYRPLYLILLPAAGGKRRHVKVRPYANFGLMTYVLHPHYPVCVDCGEPWPCPEIGITREVRRQSAEVERLSSILPGCCWSCGKPVTARQKSIVFEGENLLLPGAPSPVFHLRGKNGCCPAAMSYEDQWVAAGDDRPWRLQCSGKVTEHVDGPECDRDGCPGVRVRHAERAVHVLTAGGTLLRWARGCARCAGAAEQGACRWFPDDEVKALLGWTGGSTR